MVNKAVSPKPDVVDENLLCIGNKIFFDGSYHMFPWVTKNKRYNVRLYVNMIYFQADDGKSYSFTSDEWPGIFADQHKLRDMKIEELFNDSVL